MTPPAKQMGGSSGELGGRLSGAMRNATAARRAVPLRGVGVAPRATSAPRSAPVCRADKPTAAKARDELDLVTRAILAQREADSRAAELGAKLAEAERTIAKLTRQNAAGGIALEPSAASAPSLRERAAPASLPATKVRGTTPADREVIIGVKRGQAIIGVPKAKYRKYDQADVYELCQRILDGNLTLQEIRSDPDAYPVPYSTMYLACNLTLLSSGLRTTGPPLPARRARLRLRFGPSKHRLAVLDAEDALSKAVDISKLKVGQLKAIVLSRTGHQPKAKNNKDDAMVAEATAAVRDHPATCMPCLPAAAAANPLAGTDEVAPGEAQVDVWACVSCGAEYEETALPEPDENEHFSLLVRVRRPDQPEPL